ncbi:hypothetical protein N7461_004842 [Penicillium sp. DV-2018c]|nr:hypothetical protein N7461_004842 [Penicillium sp. DV-2018c]
MPRAGAAQQITSDCESFFEQSIHLINLVRLQLTWVCYRALIAVGLGVPIAFYLFNRSPANQAGAVTSGGGGERGANQEYTKNAEGNQGSSSGSSGPGGHDVPRAMGPPGGTGSISSKQQGLSNSDTMNPYVNESGKSRKGEGEADSAKVKGTVATDRPQK